MTDNLLVVSALWFGLAAIILLVALGGMKPYLMRRALYSFDRNSDRHLPRDTPRISLRERLFWNALLIVAAVMLIVILVSGTASLFGEENFSDDDAPPASTFAVIIGFGVIGYFVSYVEKRIQNDRIGTLAVGYERILDASGPETEVLVHRFKRLASEHEDARRLGDSEYNLLQQRLYERLAAYAESLTYAGLKRRLENHPRSVMDKEN